VTAKRRAKILFIGASCLWQGTDVGGKTCVVDVSVDVQASGIEPAHFFAVDDDAKFSERVILNELHAVRGWFGGGIGRRLRVLRCRRRRYKETEKRYENAMTH
jgi:hypothetical protein